MARSRGVSGLAVGMATAGGLLMYAGLNNVGLLEGLREVAQGKPITPRRKPALTFEEFGGDGGDFAPGAMSPPSSASGSALVSAAAKYLGRPYRLGVFDCSKLVQLAFRDIGVTDCPRTSAQQIAWRKVRKVAYAERQPGDLAYWPGHIAIVTGPEQVITNPRPGRKVRYEAITTAGPRPGRPSILGRYVGNPPSASRSTR